MKVVIVNDGLPYPPTAGNRIRTLNLMLRLARRHEITYICRGNPQADEVRQAVQFLADRGIQSIIVDDPVRPKSGPAFYGALAANLFSPLPYAVASHNSPAVWQAIREHAANHEVDLWQFEWLPYADALRGRADACTIVMAHNVETLIWQRYCQTQHNPIKKWYIRRQWKKFERFERRIFAQVTRVVAVSPQDAELASEQFGVAPAVVDNGIDKEYFAAAKGNRQANQILFLGSLEWRPNLDAVGLLLDQVFPQVLAQEPAARLCIVGRNPPAALANRIGAMRNVELHANVADVRPYLAQSGVMAVPLRIGGGSRLKILEALACGLPVVSTSVGCEGLRVSHGNELIVADEMKAMADALVECIRAPGRALEMAERGRKLVLEQYDWDVLAERLEQIWEECSCRGGFQTRPLASALG